MLRTFILSFFPESHILPVPGLTVSNNSYVAPFVAKNAAVLSALKDNTEMEMNPKLIHQQQNPPLIFPIPWKWVLSLACNLAFVFL